ncbi:tetratricopeptide repeat protein [Falsiruegeria litorea R37]|uniref:Tetratricopeptide repeat protein n=1 Tax=Falsiruegeria litorea R37 TaxID=1200284 RepID=A0A1Y5RYT0_9RHOB|nr:tetratricopeptide repeat-containing sulfotransferase family protein [Falsiruegeria litorea]SLN28742.1 tetratricopeptide repeat protein [Falsiruegeria litorea R37]
MSLQNELNRLFSMVSQGKSKKALAQAKAAIRRYGQHPALFHISALAQCAAGKQREAIPNFQKALKLDPDFHDAAKAYATVLIKLGQAKQVVSVLRRASAALPDDPAIAKLTALAKFSERQLDAASEAATHFLQLQPDDVQGYLLRADIFEAGNRLKEAAEDVMHAIAKVPNDPELWIRLSMLNAERGEHDAALQTAEQAVSIAPDYPRAIMQQANLLLGAGFRSEAIQGYRRALTLNPGEPETIDQLAKLQTTEENAGLEPSVASLFKSAKGRNRAILGFALTAIAEQKGDNAAAQSYLSAANREMAKLTPYSRKSEQTVNDKIMGRYADVKPSEQSENHKGPCPIFILGLPRSGTTLIETILGNHPDISPLGERDSCDLLYPVIDGNLVFDKTATDEFVRRDQAELSEEAKGSRFYTDKMPENHRMIGFLKTAYPDCRIIHVKRDPRDTALSMWRARFADGALAYTYDFSDMAHRFNLYAEMMQMWQRLYPDEIHVVHYEDVVSDPVSVSKRLADLCDVTWLDAMAHPETSANTVRTLTAYQLRQPVHSRSVGKWPGKEDLLKPFLDGLDPKLWPELAAV